MAASVGGQVAVGSFLERVGTLLDGLLVAGLRFLGGFLDLAVDRLREALGLRHWFSFRLWLGRTRGHPWPAPCSGLRDDVGDELGVAGVHRRAGVEAHLLLTAEAGEVGVPARSRLVRGIDA